MSKPRALVIGGTGPTGPAVVEGLAGRGYSVTVLHGGQHEVGFSVPDVEHIHVDPHFAETLESGLAGATYDLVVAQYGRLRVIAEVLRQRAGRLVAIGAATAVYAAEGDPRWGGLGRPAIVPDGSRVYVSGPQPDKLAFRMVEAMESLFDHHPDATYLGYPVNYGPRNPAPFDWTVIRRVLDGRRSLVIADGGIKLESRLYSESAAQAVLLVVDRPEAAGKRYTVADGVMHTMRQRIEFIARHLGHELELVDMPYELAWPCHPLWRHTRGHRLCDSSSIRAELGYSDLVTPDVGLGRTLDWLLANRPAPGGEAEQQIGDPFDYPREDALIERWREHRESFGAVEEALPEASHGYRHPKSVGDTWQPKQRAGG